jgi:hypothetical protein
MLCKKNNKIEKKKRKKKKKKKKQWCYKHTLFTISGCGSSSLPLPTKLKSSQHKTPTLHPLCAIGTAM